jgi:hypothetical protein
LRISGINFAGGKHIVVIRVWFTKYNKATTGQKVRWTELLLAGIIPLSPTCSGVI